MERFLSLLVAGIMSGTVSTANIQDTGWIQEQYIINDYFRWVDEQAPLVYRSGRILGKTFPGIKGGESTNKTDCSGILVGHMIKNGIVDSRNMDGMDGLDSNTLITLGKPKKRNEVVRGDRVYMKFPDGVEHIAVACDTGGENIYDLYLNNYAKCREQPPTILTRYASNGEVEYMSGNGIILPQTKEVILYFQKIKDEYQTTIGTDDTDLSGRVTTASNFLDVVVQFVSTIIGV